MPRGAVTCPPLTLISNPLAASAWWPCAWWQDWPDPLTRTPVRCR